MPGIPNYGTNVSIKMIIYSWLMIMYTLPLHMLLLMNAILMHKLTIVKKQLKIIPDFLIFVMGNIIALALNAKT